MSTLCDPMDCSLSGSSVHGIFQARVLEWIAISFSRGSSRPRNRTGSPTLQADALLSEPPGKPPFNALNHYQNQPRLSNECILNKQSLNLYSYPHPQWWSKCSRVYSLGGSREVTDYSRESHTETLAEWELLNNCTLLRCWVGGDG